MCVASLLKHAALMSKPFAQSELDFDEIVIGWFTSKNVSCGSALRPRWPPQSKLALHRTLLEIHITIFSSETTGPIATNFGGMVFAWPPSKVVSDDPDFQPKWPAS
jgi:hypothetical protein